MLLAVIAAGLGCYLLKLIGMSVPERFLAQPVMRRIADLLPVALLAALIAVQVFTSGDALTLDARAVALAAAALMLVLRAPFLVVVFGAAAIAAVLRALG